MNKSNIAWDIIYRSFTKLPIKTNKIVFESYLGRNYNDNPKAISDYLIKNEMDYNIIWFFNNPKQFEDDTIEATKKPSISYLFHLATAKYIVTNSRMPKQFEKRSDQVLLQTWHGTPLKKLALDMQENHFPNTTKIEYFMEFLGDVQNWDYLISPNAYSTDIFRRAFAFENEVLESGYPRNDRLINYHPDEINQIKKKLELDLDKKILLYTPTFRENNAKVKGHYNEKITLKFNKVLEQNPDWIILVRSHYLITEKIKFKNPNVINMTEYPDVNELYMISDVLLTDYSSAMFDFAMLNRPIIKYAPDLEMYESKMRGFYLDYHEEIPATSINNEQELGELLKNFEQYKLYWTDELVEFNQKFNHLNDGKATKRIVDKIFN